MSLQRKLSWLQAFYPDDEDEAAATCQVWHGVVTESLWPDSSSSTADREALMQADPYGCGDLWQHFMVGWYPLTQVAVRHTTKLICYQM